MEYFRITVKETRMGRRYDLEWSGRGNIEYLTERVGKLFKGMIESQTVELSHEPSQGALELESGQDNWDAIEKKLERMFRRDFNRPVTWVR